MLSAEPMDRTEAMEATDPMPRIDPADPMLSTEPADPMLRIDPLEPMLRIEPLEPMLRIDPAEPAERAAGTFGDNELPAVRMGHSYRLGGCAGGLGSKLSRPSTGSMSRATVTRWVIRLDPSRRPTRCAAPGARPQGPVGQRRVQSPQSPQTP
jgi:hypothetical protein